MPKRKGRVTALSAAQREAARLLTPERRRHGVVVHAHRFIEADSEVRAVWQGLDTTGIMLTRGSITEVMKRAGDLFHDNFQRAGLDGLHAGDLTRSPGGGGHLQREGNGAAAARKRIIAALDALGGVDTPGGSCAWHCLGLEESLRMWAARPGWSERRINHVTAAGILIADLGILVRYWGL